MKTKICRLFIKGNFSRSLEDAWSVLENVSELDINCDYFMTPGGFINIPWKFNSFSEAVEEAKRRAEELLRGIEIDANCITVGVDSYSSSSLRKPHVELVGVYDGDWHFTGKSYPTVGQERGLIRTSLESHFMELSDKVMVLGCHDLTIFNPRAKAAAKGWRRETIERFLSLAESFEPDVVLHHPHFTDSKFTWLAAWKNLEKLLPSVKHYASSSVYFREDGERSKFDDVLVFTKKGDVGDVVVNTAKVMSITQESNLYRFKTKSKSNYLATQPDCPSSPPADCRSPSDLKRSSARPS
ncbi:hypothetical protein GAH_00830 [Geoglobus ahangari]|uniref:Uncharacterized protein n=1 Tax=Geoglobus ahangari TaxID=113653 RepID=A0A0F7IEA0_9EURY|nr:hypothetical protein [Geoglobus ahangari]AKG91839.1 hypothetical protein GAH_00830 [Geoglobus ahangari]